MDDPKISVAVLEGVKEYWHVFAGVSMTFWYMFGRLKRSMFRDYATVEALNMTIHTTRVELMSKINKFDQESQRRHEEMMKMFIEHIDKGD